MHVLVTGASGFLGSHVARAFVARNIPTTALVRSGHDPWRIAGLQDRLDVAAADLNHAAALERVLSGTAPHVVCDAAWDGVDSRLHHDLQQLNANLWAHLGLIAAAGRAGCRRWIGIGSQAEYGPRPT